jgi:predicted house-cleaning noncanonical NTP pyrophosphatase (MazG superfamily)
MVHNKLVRDRIPEIIRASGGGCAVRTLSEAEYADALKHKLREEVREFEESGEAEELADILEVVYAIAESRGISACELEKLRAQKAQVRGGFRDRLFLESTEDKREGKSDIGCD